MSYPRGHHFDHEGVDLIDLRSDTVTKPTAEMRAAMAQAEVGDDVYGGDPSVQALERHAAGLFGMHAAAYFPTGTQSNLAAMLAHCGRGDEILVGRGYHIQNSEACGASVLGGIALEPLDLSADGGVMPDTIRKAVKPDDSHFARTRLLSLENTVGGRAVPLATQDAAVHAAKELSLKCHLDGARIFNACAALNVTPQRFVKGFDTVSVCLSKGLGAPVGSLLCGDTETISAARRWRKMLGGGMRQSGVLAAAGLYALIHNADNLTEDHRKTAQLATALDHLDAIEVQSSSGQTNMLWLRFSGLSDDALQTALLQHNILVAPAAGTLRLVLHRDIDDAALTKIIGAFQTTFADHFRTGTAA